MSFPRSFLFAAALVGGVAFGPGCLLDGSAFESAGAGAGGGSGGAGGNGTGTTTTGGTTTSTGTGTTGSTSSTTTTGSTTSTTTTTTPECTLDDDCPDPDPNNDCVEPRCANGTCSQKNAPDGMSCGTAPGPCHAPPTCSEGQCLSPPLPYGEALPDSNAKDCKMPVCDGQGGETTAPDDSEDPDDTECGTKLCEGGAVKTEPKAGQATCALGFLECCDGHCCDPFTCLGCVD